MTNGTRTLQRSMRPVLAALLAATLAPAARSANIWDGGSAGPGDNNWNTAANWDDDVVPTFPAALTFGGTARLAATNDLVGMTVTGVTFAAGAGAFTLRGNPIVSGEAAVSRRLHRVVGGHDCLSVSGSVSVSGSICFVRYSSVSS